MDGGNEIFVNQENKEMYVMLYLDFYFNQHCEQQFNSYKKGFFKTVCSDVINLFQPEELEQLICGSSELDFKDLQENSNY